MHSNYVNGWVIYLWVLALLYNFQGRYSEAEPLYLQALELKERVLGVNHPSTVTTRENLAILRQKKSI